MSVTAPAASLTAEAASTKQARSVSVKVGSKKVTKKTYTIVRGKSATLKVVVSPAKAKRSVSFKSSNKKIVTVSKKGKIKAKKTGTAKISITVKDKTGKKKATWVKVKVKAPLKAPSKTSVSSLKAASASSISVKWKKPSRAKGYQVQIAKNSKFTSGRKTYKTTKTGKTISGLSSGQRYYVRVRAYNKSGSTVKYGKWSSVKKVTTKKLSTPSKSSISSLSATGTSSISVKWKKSSNAKGYQVQAAKNSGFTSGRKTYTTTGLSKSISGLSSGQKYYVRVRAYNKSGSAVKYSGWSSVKTVTTKKATTSSKPACQHKWVDKYEQVQVWVVDKEAWDEDVYKEKYICCPNGTYQQCGLAFDTDEELNRHQLDTGHGSYGIYPVKVDTIHHEEVGHYETRDGDFIDRVCSKCGMTGTEYSKWYWANH